MFYSNNYHYLPDVRHLYPFNPPRYRQRKARKLARQVNRHPANPKRRK